MRRVTCALLVVAAASLGVLAEMAGSLPHPLEYLSQWIYPWVIGSALVGRAARRLVTAAAGGFLFLLVGLTANSLLKAALYGYTSIRPMTEAEWPVWLLVALILGTAFGVTGLLSRTGRGRLAPAAGGALVGAGLAEAAVNLTGLLAWGLPVVIASTTTAVAMAVVLARRRDTGDRLVIAASALVVAGVAFLVAPVLQSAAGIA